ncbi:ankyrin repeat domain containing protein 50 [Echinococcus multilocularis]|uniref:Ankyrin repeat domain containing protein 50 n=1 Tax=Echinococcus multilocularis TaxID=6211 RepID=A0A068YME6_ECHMU|nr:ankyrin repeat domain containing protein 50 [Echinococcus multilocularis]
MDHDFCAQVDNNLIFCDNVRPIQPEKDHLDASIPNPLSINASRNGAASPPFDSSESDALIVGRPIGNPMSKSLTNSDSALPLSYSSKAHVLRAPSLPPSITSKCSTGSDTNTAPPEVPIRTSSSPQKHNSLPCFIGRNWVFDKVFRWLQLSSDGTPTSTDAMYCSFILMGGPGTGKTAILNEIIKNNPFGLSTRLLAYHACSNQFVASINLPRFILSLRDQLTSRQDAIGAFYRERLAAGGGRLNHLFTTARLCAFPDEVLSEGIFKILGDLDPRQIGSDQKLFFAIDAADECLRLNPNSEVRAPPSISSIGCFHKRLSQASSISDHVNEFQNLNLHQSTGRIRQGWVSRNLLELLAINALFLPPWIGLFITCRRDSQTILRRLFRCASTVFLDDIRCPLVYKDMNDYICMRLKNDSLLQNAFDLCGQDILHILQYKCNASLLYLHIVLTAVSECWLTPEYIKTIPGTINGLFLWLCQRLLNPFPNDPFSSIMTTIKPVLSLVLTSSRPLTLDEIDVILQSNKVSSKIIENWRQVLVLPFFLVHQYPKLLQQQPQQWVDLLDYAELQHERVLSLAHTSLRDWFLDVKCSTPVYLSSSRDGHTMLALAALNQICQFSCLPRYFTWDILYNFTRSSLYNSTEALQMLTETLKDVNIDFTVNILANLDCWMILNDPILVHCSFAGSSISQLIEEALNYEHRLFEPQASIVFSCNGTQTRERKPQQVILQTRADKETSIGQLCTAAFQGKLEVVKCILRQNSVDVEARDAAGSTPLVLASRQGHLQIVKCLLEANAKLDQIDQDGWSALRSAAWGGHTDVVNFLLDSGVDVDITGPDSRTALRAAAWAGHAEIVRRLLAAGADVNRPDAEGRTPLIAAAYMGCEDIIDILADAGANLNHADQDGRTALCVAAFCVPQSVSHSEVVAKLLQLGADPNLGDRENVTPLIGAANAGRRDICELCLEADADVDRVDKSGRSALVAAVVNGHVDVVQLLLFWCAAVDTIDLNGRSVLSIAAACGRTQVVRQLLDRGLDEGHRDHMGATPLHLAAAAGHADVVRLLLEAGSHPDEIDNAGQTPLLVACQADHVGVVQLLLKPAVTMEATVDNERVQELFEVLTSGRNDGEVGEETGDPHRVYDPLTTGGQDGFLGHATLQTIDRASMDGRNPLRSAALNNNVPLVKLLIALGADPDQQDSCGRTTLSVVVLEGLVKMAKVLLFTPTACNKGNGKKQSLVPVGANPLIADDEGRFPLHIASWQGNLTLVHLLLQVGTPVDVRDKENRTPLHSAAWQNHAKTCNALIELGADINAVCSQGASALCIAAQEGHSAVCEVLLQRGADALQVDAYGRTPYKVAMKAGHGEICALLERYGAVPPPSTSLRFRHRWKQMAPTSAIQFSQQHQHHRQHRQLQHSQQPQTRQVTVLEQKKVDVIAADSVIPSACGFEGHIKMGRTVITSGPTLLQQQQQNDTTTGAYARPSIELINAVPAPPPHLRSCRQHQQQPCVQMPQQQQLPEWSSTPMTFDPSQWQSPFPQGLQISPTPVWCPTPRTTQPIYTPPMLFATQPTTFDRNQSQQPVYQPAYVLSPQGILVPAQAPYFVPMMQHSQFQLNASQFQSEIPPPEVLATPSCAATTTKASSTIENTPTATIHSQRPSNFYTVEEVRSVPHQNMEAPANLTFSGGPIASPVVSESAAMPHHYSAATPILKEDIQKPSSDRPTIQLIVNTKLGEDVINLNEVTDSEYESSVWVSRRQVTVMAEAAVERGSKIKKGTKSRQSTSPERQHHGSRVKAAIQGAWKGVRRKKTTSTPGSPGVSTVPVKDKMEKSQVQQLQQQESQTHAETHI